MFAIRNLNNQIFFISPGDVLEIRNNQSIIVNDVTIADFETEELCQKYFDYVSDKFLCNAKYVDLRKFFQ